MKSHATRGFWRLYSSSLPPAIRQTAVKQYRLWMADPRHRSLQFKKVGAYWSARVTDDYRAVGIMAGDAIVWFWVGTHAEYDRLLKA